VSFFEIPKNEDKLNQDLKSDQSNTLILNNRQLSWLAAGLIALVFFVFIGGYFLGQKKALERFSSQIDQDSLSDKIATSLYSMYDTTDEDESAEASDALDASDSGEGEEAATPETPVEEQKEQPVVKVAQTSEPVAPSKPLENKVEKTTTKKCYAELVGFGAEKTAQGFVTRLRKKGITVVSKKHESKTAKGKRVAWYQIVTPNYESYDKLVDVVAKIKREEHLKGVRMVTC
jgi:hypothetical protein